MRSGLAPLPWHEPFAARLAALAPLAPAARLVQLDAWAGEAALATETGRRLRFVQASQPAGPPEPAPPASTPAPPGYETRIFETGEVATRIAGPGARHDLYNALVWLVYPRSKARLNALHADAIAAGPGSAPRRGPVRDAATVFDENAALWVGPDASLEAALRAFDWPRLFVAERSRLAVSLRVRVFGHALLEKLDEPFKGITAHAWPLRIAADASSAAIDAALADSLAAGPPTSRALCPLPVMGLPGWCDANRDPAFYNDAGVFRPGRVARRGGAPTEGGEPDAGGAPGNGGAHSSDRSDLD